jgi:peptide deformylase
VIKNADDDWEFLVNCDYVPTDEEKAVSIEGCLSLRRDGKLRAFRIERWKNILLEGKILRENSKGKIELSDVSCDTHPNIYSVIYQHEVDHTRSVLISDIGEEIDLR